MKNILTVLVIDEDEKIRSEIVEELTYFCIGFAFTEDVFCYNVISATSGEAAMQIIENQVVDIILLDNQLPDIAGMEIIRRIKQLNLDNAQMMLTSEASLSLAVDATKNGVYNFITKPISSYDLKAAVQDITKHLYLKRMTKKMNFEGKQIRFKFLSVLSHELKSPLNAVEGYLRIMQDKQAGEQIDDYKNMIDRSLIRLNGMRNLILDMLDLTRIESGKKNRNLKLIDLREIASISISTNEPLSIQRNVKMNLIPKGPVMAEADPEEMEIIFNNLVSNAVKYNVEGGDVFIDIYFQGKDLIIKVRDTGIGIAEEDQKVLFQEFTRIKNAQTRDISGSGLGLSIIKKMVSLYGGEIKLNSQPGLGTEFTVEIPVPEEKLETAL
jgi:two-component system, sensor histidine kinase and response regulator